MNETITSDLISLYLLKENDSKLEPSSYIMWKYQYIDIPRY